MTYAPEFQSHYYHPQPSQHRQEYFTTPQRHQRPTAREQAPRNINPKKTTRTFSTLTPKNPYQRHREQCQKKGLEKSKHGHVNVGVLASEGDESAGCDIPFLPLTIVRGTAQAQRKVIEKSLEPIIPTRCPTNYYVTTPPKAKGLTPEHIISIVNSISKPGDQVFLPDPAKLRIRLLETENERLKDMLKKVKPPQPTMPAPSMPNSQIKSPLAKLMKPKQPPAKAKASVSNSRSKAANSKLMKQLFGDPIIRGGPKQITHQKSSLTYVNPQ